MRRKKITVCLDMYGCPNRCRHCWLGVTHNGNMSISEIEFTAQQFKPFTDCLQIMIGIVNLITKTTIRNFINYAPGFPTSQLNILNW